jgi:hypothetical protein
MTFSSSIYFSDAVTKAAMFFIISSILLVVAEIFCLCGHVARHKRIFTFVSGLIFIISGKETFVKLNENTQ